MVRQVAKRLAGLFCDEKIDVICVLGGPYVGKTWLVSYALEWTNKEYIKVFDNVNTYDEFENLVKQKSQENDKYVIVSRLGLDRCKEIVDGDMAIEYVMVYPMNYREFVLAMPVSFNIYSEELLKIYMMVGGLPEVVNTFIKTGDIDIVRNKQRELFQEMCNELTEKGQKLIYEVIRQELLDSTGFCIRQIANSARDREYARVIEELIGIGITERVKRLVIDADRGVRKYKLNIYDMGIYSMVMDLTVNDLCTGGNVRNKRLLYDFYYKELRTYINSSECIIKYWKKYRAKAKLAMVIEKYENHHIRYIPILISDGNNSISKSVQSFSKEYSVTTPICIPVPNADKVIDGWELHEKICNNT